MVAPLGNVEAREHYAKQEDAIHSTPNLTFVPGVPLSETDALFDRAKLLVLTSIGEGYPNAIMQAMWAGTPIATYDFDPDRIVALLKKAVRCWKMMYGSPLADFEHMPLRRSIMISKRMPENCAIISSSS